MSPVNAPTPPSLYTLREIIARGKFSKTHLYTMVRDGLFPAPALRCGPRFTRWTSDQVDQFFADPQGYMNAHRKADAVTGSGG